MVQPYSKNTSEILEFIEQLPKLEQRVSASILALIPVNISEGIPLTDGLDVSE